MNNPQIDVIMPTLNAEMYLVEAIRSLQNQSYTNWKLHILDGGSTDLTATISLGLGKDDKRITFEVYKDIHPTERVNNFLKQTNAPYFAFLHADDVCHQDRLQKQVETFENDADLTLLGTATHFWLHDKRLSHHKGYEGTFFYPQGHDNICARLPFFWCFSLPTLMARTSVIQKNELFLDPSFKYCADYDWYFRISKRGKVGNLADPLLSYRHHSASDGPLNKSAVDLEARSIKSKIVRECFPDLSAEEVEFLARLEFEPGISEVSYADFNRAITLLQRLPTMCAKNISSPMLHSVISKYIGFLKFHRQFLLVNKKRNDPGNLKENLYYRAPIIIKVLRRLLR